jgi:hypothetical protein
MGNPNKNPGNPNKNPENPNKKKKKKIGQIREIQIKKNFSSFFYYIKVFIDSEMRSRGY